MKLKQLKVFKVLSQKLRNLKHQKLNSPGHRPKGVSEPRHQCPVPVHCSLRVLDSSSGVQGDTIYGVLGGGGRGTLPVNLCSPYLELLKNKARN